MCVLVVSTAASIAVAQEFRTIGGEFQVNSFTPGYQSRPAVGLAASRRFVVTWQSNGQDGDESGVFARRFNAAGTPQGVELQINTTTTGDQRNPRVAVGSGGAFVVVWGQNASGSREARVRRFDSAGVAQTGEIEVGAALDVFLDTDIAIDGDGDFVVVWQSADGQDGLDHGVFGRRFDASGVAQGAAFQVNTHTIVDQSRPAVAMSPAGDFVVAWQNYGQDGQSYGVFARRFDASGVAQGVELAVNLFTLNGQETPTVAMDSRGDFFVAWESGAEDGSYGGVFARRFASSGAALGGELQVNVFTSNTQGAAQVATNDDAFMVTWISAAQDGDANGVFARRFRHDGTALGGELQVNTVTADAQNVPAIAVDDAGDAIVTWNGPGDGSDAGVFAQRYRTLAVFDVDGNGSSEPLTDGLLVLRFLFGFTGGTLVTGAVDLVNCTRCDSAAIKAYLDARN